MRFSVKATPGTLPAILDTRITDAPREAELRLRDLGAAGASIATGLAPVGPTGGFKAGIDSSIEPSESSPTVRIGSSDPEANIVESGRRPGRMPPTDVIADVYGLDPTEAFPVARAIGERGTPAHKVFERTHSALQPRVRAMELVRRIGRLL